MTKTKRTRSGASPAPAIAPYETTRPGEAESNLRESSLFLDDRGPVWETLHRLARRLEDAGIPYAVIGAMALNAHGYKRVTTDIDLVASADARRRIHELLDGRGFLPPFEGSRNLRDTTNGVRVDLVLAGEFPGDGNEKPVVFPDPSVEPLFVQDDVRYLTLEKLIELKLASGMTNPGRLRDLADVQSATAALRLPRDFGERLHPWVRPKWYEIWDAWDADPRKDEF